MTTTKTIVTVAEKIYNNMEYRERTNGDKFCCLKNDVQWQRDIIREAHLDRLPNDDIYDRINTILEVISNLDNETNEDDIREALYQIEPDCYTSDLTKWLNSDNRNVYYLNDTIDLGSKDGFELLSYAQNAYIQEIGHALISAIQEYIDGLE